jgi:hypothetical protein
VTPLRILYASTLLTLAGCEFFHPTTVPVSDMSDPWAVVSLYFDGDHQELRVGDMSPATAVNTLLFDEVTDDPYQSFIAIAAGVDGSGVHEVEIHSRVIARCVYGPANLQVLEPWSTRTVTRVASPGDTVQDGLYTFETFRGIDYVSDFDFCPDNSYQASLEWYARAENFHGGVAYYGRGRVTYVQFGS